MNRVPSAALCALAGLLLLLPVACATTAVPVTTTSRPSASATHTPARATTAPAPSATLTPGPTDTPTTAPSATPTATLDATRAAGMTLEAIRLAVTASGVPEGSSAFVAQVDATRCAVLPPPTSTPLPWAVVARPPVVVSANCLGSDLPGQGARIWQDGQWLEAAGFSFAQAADLELARQHYLDYLNYISFQAGPPTDDFAADLGDYMNSAGALPSPESCLAETIAGRVAALRQDGHYVRLTLTQPVQWDEPYYLFLDNNAAHLALPWQVAGIRQEFVSITTSEAARQAPLSRLAGTAWLRYDAAAGDWRLEDDDGGYYCHALPGFVE